MVQGNKRSKKSIEKKHCLLRTWHIHTGMREILYKFYDFIEWKTIKIEHNEISSSSSVNDEEKKH